MFEPLGTASRSGARRASSCCRGQPMRPCRAATRSTLRRAARLVTPARCGASHSSRLASSAGVGQTGPAGAVGGDESGAGQQLARRRAPVEEFQAAPAQQGQQRRNRVLRPGRRRPLLQRQGAEAAHLAGHHPPGALVPVDLALPGQSGAEQLLHRLPGQHIRQPDLPFPARLAGHLHRHQPLSPLDRRAWRKLAAEAAAEEVAAAAGLPLPADAVGIGRRQQPPDARSIGGRFPAADGKLLPPVARRPRRTFMAAAAQQFQAVEQVAVAGLGRKSRRRPGRARRGARRDRRRGRGCPPPVRRPAAGRGADGREAAPSFPPGESDAAGHRGRRASVSNERAPARCPAGGGSSQAS